MKAKQLWLIAADLDVSRYDDLRSGSLKFSRSILSLMFYYFRELRMKLGNDKNEAKAQFLNKVFKKKIFNCFLNLKNLFSELFFQNFPFTQQHFFNNKKKTAGNFRPKKSHSSKKIQLKKWKFSPCDEKWHMKPHPFWFMAMYMKWLCYGYILPLLFWERLSTMMECCCRF